MGLRESKKERVREQLLQATLALIAQKGFEQTTIAEIADVVQVSPRTFLRYFATKEDVITAWLDDEFALLVETLVQWPDDATPVNAMTGAMRAFLASYEARHDFFLKIEKVIAASPAITDRKAAKASSVGNELRAILAARMELDEGRDLLPGLIAGTVACACGAAIRSWLAVDGEANLVMLYDEAIASIDFNGLDRSCHAKPRLAG